MAASTQDFSFRLTRDEVFTEERIFCPEGTRVAYYVTRKINFRLSTEPAFVRKVEKEIAEHLLKLAGRITTPRKMLGEHDKKEFDYPFEECLPPQEFSQNEDEYAIRPIPHLPSVPLGNFPKNISRWIWSAAGWNDGDPWEMLVELDDEKGKRYAFFHAWCDYTGFDCQGGYYITVASTPEALIEFGMENETYQRYIKTTEPADSWE